MERKSIKIFVVDDDASFGKALETAISRAGFGAQLFSKADEVVKATQLQFPHVMIVDCLLPKTSGVNLVLQLREQGAKETHFFFTSGIFKDKSFIKDTLQKTNASGFFPKPFDINELLKEIEKALGDVLVDDSLQSPFLEILTRANTGPGDRLKVVEQTPEIHGFEVPRILSLLQDKQTVGTLTLTDPQDMKARISIFEGNITRIQMDRPNSLFGSLLVEKNLVTVDAIDALLKHPAKIPIGQRLIEANLLSPHIIPLVNSEQAGVRLSQLIADISYRVSFSKDPNVETETTIPRNRLALLFGDWIYSKINPVWLKTFYLPWMTFHIYKTETFSEKSPYFNLPPLSLTPDLSQKISQGQSIQEIVSDKRYSEDEILGSIHLLILAGMIVFEKRESKGQISLSVEKLSRISQEMKSKNFFQILGVSQTSSSNDIKKAYHELAKTFHPDKLPATVSSEIRGHTQSIFSQMTAAYESLRDTEKRAEYIKRLEHGRAEMIIQGEALLDEGLALVKSKDPVRALEKLKAAADLGIHSAELQLATLWAKLLQIPSDEQDPKKIIPIQTAINKIPPEDRHSALYFFVKGLMLKASGEMELATNSFKQALYLTPGFPEATRELKAMQNAKTKQPDLLHADLKDVVGMLFKKKR